MSARDAAIVAVMASFGGHWFDLDEAEAVVDAVWPIAQAAALREGADTIVQMYRGAVQLQIPVGSDPNRLRDAAMLTGMAERIEKETEL